MNPKNNFHILLLSASLLFVAACKKDAGTPQSQLSNITEQPTVENGRLAFDSHDDFYNYIRQMEGKSGTKVAGFTPLSSRISEYTGKVDILPHDVRDFLDFGFPSGFLAALNEKGEVKIGEEIIWYHNGKKYFIPAADEKDLESIKQHPNKIVKVSDTKLVKLSVSPPQNSSGRVDIGIRATDARHQFEFYTNGPQATGTRKFVHEVVSFYDDRGFNRFRAWVILRMKLEWRGCCNWNPAGETREIRLNVSGWTNLASFSSYTIGPIFRFNQTWVGSGDYSVVLSEVVAVADPSFQPTWALEMTGSIYHYVQGDQPQNAWTNAGNPILW